MARVLIIGAGGVGQVVAHKCVQAKDVFSDICLASRTESKCRKIAAQLSRPIQTAQVDADNVPELVALIRSFKPDVVITHRTCDYHPDHRITAQIVLDCSFIVRVPLYCPDAPVPAETPVFAFCYDGFTKPAPFRADAVSEIDSVLDDKLRMLDCHASQFYEWLPFNSFGIDRLDAKSMSWREKKELILKLLPINKTCAGLFRRQLARVYGAGKKIEHAEAFEASEYGRTVEPAQFQALFEP